MTDNILSSINILLEKIYKSVEGSVYDILDKLIDIGPTLLDNEPLKYIFNENDKYGIIFIATSLILFYVVQYMLLKLISMYNGNNPENIFKFVIRMILTVILASSSKYICEVILNVNNVFTELIANLGKDITGEDISFKNFSQVITNLEEYMSQDNVSIDGLIKGIISFGSVTLLINYAVRYVTVIFAITVMPITIMFSISPATRGIFYSWLKLSIINLCQQWIVKLLLIIPISFRDINGEMFKIVILGTMYMLYRMNIFIKELFGNIYSGSKEKGAF